jgi:hypothetical protein
MVTRIAVLGASGIGLIHARHYQQLGAKIVAVMCSTQPKADQIAQKLSLQYKSHIKAFDNIDAILEEELDGVSICTPPSLHFVNIQKCFDKNLPVFCEKPLFWDSSMGADEIIDTLEKIEIHPNRRLFVNTSNTVFIDAITKARPYTGPSGKILFEFFTNGSHTGIGIAHDLLPHGLSILIHLLGDCEIRNFNTDISLDTYECVFSYGNCAVNFKFRENPEGPRHMRISINENSYTRIQTSSGSSYGVSLVNDVTKEVIPTVDPFGVYISKFLNFIECDEHAVDDGFILGALNLSLMAQVIHLSEKALQNNIKSINNNLKVV